MMSVRCRQGVIGGVRRDESYSLAGHGAVSDGSGMAVADTSTDEAADRHTCWTPDQC